MTLQTLAPGEVAPMHNLYVVTRGLVVYGGRVLSRGMAWGDDVILSDPRYYLPFHARAMTYVDALTLSADTLAQVLNIFPASARSLRKKVVWLALRRHLISLKKKIQAEAEGRDAPDDKSHTRIHVTLLDRLSRHNTQTLRERNTLPSQAAHRTQGSPPRHSSSSSSSSPPTGGSKRPSLKAVFKRTRPWVRRWEGSTAPRRPPRPPPQRRIEHRSRRWL
jgi:L-fucose mutarotase/ribose pyranase (RbsD/FucU family)